LKNQIAVLEKAKQISLYCDFFEGCFYEPNDIVTEHMAREAFIWIKNRVKLFGSAEKDFQKHKILDKLNPEVYKDITLK
jgi:hypothetical protein